jgi:transcriptional regulator with XRE-family HTH domain
MSKYYEIGKTLRGIRREAGLSLRDMEEKTGIPFQQISTWERDEFEPKLDKIHDLLRACNSSEAEFFDKARKNKVKVKVEEAPEDFDLEEARKAIRLFVLGKEEK